MSQHNLPSGWVAEWDEQYKTYFYVNEYTGRSQWEKPHQANSSNHSGLHKSNYESSYNPNSTYSHPPNHNSHQYENDPRRHESRYSPSHNSQHNYQNQSPLSSYSRPNEYYPSSSHKQHHSAAGLGEGVLAAGAGAIGATILNSAFSKHNNPHNSGYPGGYPSTNHHNQSNYNHDHQNYNHSNNGHGNYQGGGSMNGISSSLLANNHHKPHNKYNYEAVYAQPQHTGRTNKLHNHEHHGGLLTRFAESILSPGTATDDELLHTKRNRHHINHDNDRHNYDSHGRYKQNGSFRY